MYNTSDAFKRAIQAKDRELRLKATLRTESQTYKLTAADFEGGSLSIIYQCMSKGFELGTAIAADLSFSLNNRDQRWNDVDLEGASITPYCGIVLEDKTVEYVPMGVFVIDLPGRPYAIIEAKAGDRMILLDRPFGEINVTYPTTLKTILQAVCGHCLLPVSARTLGLAALSQRVEKRPEGELSCRDIVGEIALYAAGFARMNRLGELEITQIPKSKAGSHKMPSGSRFDFAQMSELITITGVRYGDALYGKEGYVIELAELALLPTGSNITALADKIIGYSYTASRATYPGDPSIDVGDWIRHATRDGRAIYSILTKHSYKHGGKCQLLSDGKTKPASTYKSKNARRLASIASEIKADTQQKLSNYQLATAQLNDRVGMMLGTYPSEETLPDGSKVYYFHDKPTREESRVIWRFNGDVMAISEDGGHSWNAGLTSDSNLIIKQIQTIGLNAEWIRLTDGTKVSQAVAQLNRATTSNQNDIDSLGMTVSNNTIYDGKTVAEHVAELSAEQLQLTQQISDLKSAGGNLIRNAMFGNTEHPSSAWWSTGATWGGVELRHIKWETIDQMNWEDVERGLI